MKTKWKIPAFLAAAVLVGFGALYAYLISYDFNSLKPEIISTVRDFTGRELTIKGDIRVVIGLLPSLVIEEVSFQNASWGTRPRMFHIKRFEMQLVPLSLITGTFEIGKISLIDSEIFLERNRKGELNLPFAKSGSPGAKSPGGPLSRLLEIDLKSVRIVNSRLVFRPERDSGLCSGKTKKR